MFATAWMHQLGRIDPSARCSFRYPMAQAIRPVKPVIKTAFTGPVKEKNMAP